MLHGATTLREEAAHAPAAIIGLDTTHGFIYPALLNGYDPAALTRHSPPIVGGIFPTGGLPSVAGARVVACYDADPARARAVAEACLIERVCRTPDEALTGVDGVLSAAAKRPATGRQATPAVEAGLPTFVDKPFTETVDDARALLALADRRGAPLFCTSALRYAPDGVAALRERLPELVGEPLAAHSIGTGDFDSYAVHSLEILFGLWGGGVTAVQSLGQPGHDVVRLVYGDGREALWQTCRRARLVLPPERLRQRRHGPHAGDVRGSLQHLSRDRGAAWRSSWRGARARCRRRRPSRSCACWRAVRNAQRKVLTLADGVAQDTANWRVPERSVNTMAHTHDAAA